MGLEAGLAAALNAEAPKDAQTIEALVRVKPELFRLWSRGNWPKRIDNIFHAVFGKIEEVAWRHQPHPALPE